MSRRPGQNARDYVIATAEDARHRPFIIGYLLSCLDERHWEALADAAVEFSSANVERQRDAINRVAGLPDKRA